MQNTTLKKKKKNRLRIAAVADNYRSERLGGTTFSNLQCQACMKERGVGNERISEERVDYRLFFTGE